MASATHPQVLPSLPGSSTAPDSDSDPKPPATIPDETQPGDWFALKIWLGAFAFMWLLGIWRLLSSLWS
jgi:hypothetical protein